MANRTVDIAGVRSGELVAIEATGVRIRGQVAWKTRCDCGSDFLVPGSEFRAARYISCGCKANGKPRGISRHPLYAIHHGIVDRCTNPARKDFHRYGGRGVSICPEWLDLETFAAAVGDRPSRRHSLDRIDNEQGYQPGNVRWATPSEQSRNTRRNYFPGQSSIEVCKIAGVNPGTFRNRVSKGWSIEEALNGRDFRRSQH